MCNWAVDHSVVAFSELAGNATQRLVLRVTALI